MPGMNEILAGLGLPAADGPDLPASEKQFPDGAEYRVEIPSTEGPRALRAVVEAAQKLRVTVHRVSQGSGIMLHTDDEIREMLRIGRDNGMEVSLFVGPRAAWDTGAQVKSSAGAVLAGSLRGADQLAYALADVRRGCELGLRGILVADPGLLWAVTELKRSGHLPPSLVVKTSVQLATANPAAARVWESLGADTLNVAVDLSLAHMSAIRRAVAAPLDVYVESPDNFGGFVRHYEAPELVRVAAPVYVKLGLRNAPDIYPCGSHLESTAIALSIERVRRARLVLDMIERFYAEARMSALGAPGLGLPEL
jgi:hypothetical protein